MNEISPRGLGIDSARVRFATFAVGGGLAALAGALITPLSSVDPNMGLPWLVSAFMLVMVSGGSLFAPGLVLPRARRRSGDGINVRQSDTWRADDCRLRSDRASRPSRRICACLMSVRLARRRRRRSVCLQDLWMTVLSLLVVGGVVLAPLLLDTYMVNILIRAFFVAIAAVTVDIMWGYMRHADIRSIGLLRHWCLCACDRLHRIRLWILADPFRGGGSHHRLGSGRRSDRLALVLSGFNAALRLSCLACRSDRAGTDSLFGRHIHRVVQRARRIREFRSVVRELVPSGRLASPPLPPSR